ncbi:MAG TPA: macro domain-containing protein [Firmicutes bacterium]|nr:macro domain-containing protein [Bacillota bacterium]
MPLAIVRADITEMQVDAIVNAANTSLLAGGGVCGGIFAAAGAQKLERACAALAPIEVGEAVITPGFDLPARYVIHTAGPVYRGLEEDSAKLHRCYVNSLRLAVQKDCESIAFPLISSGVYRYPKAEALQIATSAIRDFLTEHDLHVFLVVYDKDAFLISEHLFGEVEDYLWEHLVEERYDRFITGSVFESRAMSVSAEPLEDLIGNLDQSFGETLLSLIDAKGKTDVEVYKRANLDRRLFSKIRSIKGYLPSKRTALALAIALELSLQETNDLLACAGFTLSSSQKFDVIIEYFIIHGRYDIFEINEVLFSYDQPLLGA